MSCTTSSSDAVARGVDDLVERIALGVIANAAEPGAVGGLRVGHQSLSSIRIEPRRRGDVGQRVDALERGAQRAPRARDA